MSIHLDSVFPWRHRVEELGGDLDSGSDGEESGSSSRSESDSSSSGSRGDDEDDMEDAMCWRTSKVTARGGYTQRPVREMAVSRELYGQVTCSWVYLPLVSVILIIVLSAFLDMLRGTHTQTPPAVL